MKHLLRTRACFALGLMSALWTHTATAAPDEALLRRVREAQPAVISTLRELVEIESGSRDLEGLKTLAGLLQKKLTDLGASTELVEHSERTALHDAPAQTGPTVVARLRGTGTSRILLLAHMDTVYPRGTLAKLPFRVEGHLAYGPGIADDKSGIANILHALRLITAQGPGPWGQLTVLINGDEEISTPGARDFITRTAAEHDFVLSCEPTGVKVDGIGLATSGIGAALLQVKGRSAHAGVNPEDGRNALVELAHQILATRDLSVADKKIKFNWTMAKAGTTRNVIPDEASAAADVRVQKVTDLAVIERSFKSAIAQPLIEGTQVHAAFEKRRPPLEASEASRRVARLAQEIYGELGKTLAVDESGRGGGTDAAFAALSGKPAVVESLGFAGWNYHSNEAEYVDLRSIEPRLYLLTRLILRLSQGAAR